METTPNKRRTPSRCRQWEKNRRNKFNDAISRLGETVKEINKTLDGCCKDDNTQYPKIDIIENAIVCLQRCSKEKTQMKADILALQVKIEGFLKKKNTKDASTQVLINFRKDKQNGKFVNIVMIKDKDSKRKALKEKAVLTTNVIDKSSPKKSSTKESTQRSLPLLVPKITSNNKKGPENTIVVLPAAQYILPQRPLLLPTMPPTFVLVDHLQTLNKSTFPVTNRTNNGDITKTTMVNIVPITAYSRPLSANKSKKSKIKHKINVIEKSVMKSKQDMAADKDLISSELSTSNEIVNNAVSELNEMKIKTGVDNYKCIEKKENSSKACDIPKKSEISDSQINTSVSHSDNIQSLHQKDKSSVEVLKEQSNEHNSSGESTKKVCANADVPEKTAHILDSSTVPPRAKVEEETNQSKLTTPKQLLPEDKDKENKLPAILDAALCENTVDGGNARLELAEEFLAASPTAAFLMSFPLVSGNRADSPAEETQSHIQVKDHSHKRDTTTVPQIIQYFEKPNDQKSKSSSKTNIVSSKPSEQTKFAANIDNKATNSKTSNEPVITSNISNENPFLNLPMTSLISTSSGTVSDATYLDFDCSLGKNATTQSATYISNSNLFYKGDPFNTVKSSIYSTSNISSGHEFNSFGLYPCAMEKYTAKNKTDFLNVEDNLMKISNSRLTYDIDLGWSHKGFDFVASTSAPTTFSKDNVLTTSSGSYASSYNPFNSEFHLPLTSTSNKKDNGMTKTSSSFADTITSFYSQPPNLWAEDVPFYTSTNITKNISSKQQNYLPIDHTHPTNMKPNNSKSYDSKQLPQIREETLTKSTNIITTHQVPEKYTKKSPSKMHINWMTSEIRPMHSNCNLPHSELKGTHKTASVYGQVEHISKKQEHNGGNYFPISMSNFQQVSTQEELHIWPSTRQAGTTEISIEPPPINLPTLVGDLALGPHDKKKTSDNANRGANQADLQHCSNLFSVTQLMNRSSDNNVPSRYHGQNVESSKSIPTKQNVTQASSDNNRKSMSRLEHHIPEPCYIYNDSKTVSSYENNMNSYTHTQGKSKLSKSDKNSKAQKHSYSAEALIRGGSCTQKLQDSARFIGSTQKYNEYGIHQDNSIAQVSHFPPLIDYSDNSYTGQQYSGTTLYNSTTNTITNSFYTNFIPGSSNIMPSNYGNGPFSSDFMDYNQTPECNYNHKYEEQKIRNNPSIFQQDRVPSNYKSSRRESAAKHKLECSKKESSKKYQSKRAKLNADVDEWSDPNLLWQNKQVKRHPNLVTEELPFPNYVGNQMAGQYQPELFNGPLVPANVQGMGAGHNTDRSLANFAATSRTNFNLSTIFPEITMKVQ